MNSNKKNRWGFFAMLLALLGIGGCGELNEDDPNFRMEVMYGVPTVHYSIKGKVTDENGKAVDGIQVRVQRQASGDNRIWYDDITAPISSGADGKWSVEPRDMPTSTLKIIFTDTDGEANGGEFATDSIQVPVNIVKDPKNKDPWYDGDAKVEVPTVKLKKK